MSACPLTCATQDPAPFCPYACVDGCECDPGFYQDGFNCVPVEECGCTIDGYYYSIGSSYVTSNCNTECECKGNNTFECSSISCDTYAYCGTDSGDYGCHCLEGFVGDGHECTPLACLPEPCAWNATCLYRPSFDLGFFCACEDSNTMGLYCNESATYTEEFTCYGLECANGYFTSVNYPEFYLDNYVGWYRVFVPNATSITFRFNSDFAIEHTKDALYVGPGLMYTDSVMERAAVEAESLYFLTGYGYEGPIIIEGDTAWMYFTTDFSVRYEGWHASFEAGFGEFDNDQFCFYNTQTRMNGEVWDLGVCDTCSCTNGTVMCTNVSTCTGDVVVLIL
ncbi:fibropellin-1-like [Anneissia japonica]|uniref:fibropellin-1-like n=1 Tax=Anneissia japonica TaxID=1529436 RepID=UPI00142554A6|nr:fibropellin-1-like [Anneissia japonica]